MQQKAQIINTILHEPGLIIIDEPFTALDPVNTQLVKDLIRELRSRGATILMSTHQMHQVEELCDRIALIDEGLDVLYGPLGEIRRRFAGDAVLVRAEGELPLVPGVEQVSLGNGDYRLELANGITAQNVLESLVARKVQVERFEVAVPTLDEIFIRVVTD
jgi:ABC-2 type transport system ATP-binding protein